MILDIPRFKCLVDKKFLTNQSEFGFVEAYCFSVTLIEARPLLFTIHTVDGAVYSRIPINALFLNEAAPKQIRELDQWGAISSNGQVIEHQYLKDYHVETPIGEGRYGFTIDYMSGGFSEDPTQHKTSNVIFLNSGHIAAYPNNFLRFVDEHFTEDMKNTYRRNTIYYWI